MSRRLAFQTQLASIMEVLANAAVAEICKLVDDDYAVVSFQMSQCQRENKALKRKLHLLELKLARGTAERRHRDLTGNHPGNSSRAAGLRAAAEPLQEPLPPAGDVFVQHMEEALWSSRSIGEEAAVPILSDNIQPLSPDVELVKEEKMEANMVPDADPEEGLRLIGDDGVLECSPAGAGAASQKCDLEQKDCQSHSKSQIQSSPTKPVNSRGVEEEEPDVVLVKVEEAGPTARTRSQTGLNIQEGLVESSTDDYRGAAQLDETTPTSDPPSDLQECGRGFSESAGGVRAWSSEDSSSTAEVQLRIAHSNGSSKAHSQQRNSSSHSSELALFELETFFTRWAPERDVPSAPSETSCSGTSDEAPEPDPVESMATSHHALQLPSTSRKSNSLTLSEDSASQGPSSLKLESRPLTPPRPQTPPQLVNRAAVVLQQTQAPVRGSVSMVTDLQVAFAGQHGASLLARYANSPPTLATPTERSRRYMCRMCGKAFSGVSNLEAHKRVHTGEKPFRCDTCGKHFSEAGNLKKHQRVHTGEKPFRCEHCGKRFAWICNLRTHQQSSTCCSSLSMNL